MELPPAFLDEFRKQLGEEFEYPEDAAPLLTDLSDADFVVIGSGAGGAVVAARLADAFPDFKVILLESGGDPPLISEIPALWHQLWKTTAWTYPCEPRKDSTFGSLRGQRPCLIRGRCLGGTSTINGMPYLRGHPSDYDSWNIPEWSYNDVLPFFCKSEDMRDKGISMSCHGVTGEVTVEAATGKDPMKFIIKKAGVEMGFPVVTDLNAPPHYCVGFGDVHRTQRNGTRCSTAKSFLSRASGRRDNLLIARHSTAVKILFSASKRAVGVVVNGTTVRVSKEVILAAGAIASPQLLLLSGVGPAEHLDKIGVPKVIDLPVGASFHDHAIFHGVVFSVPSLEQELSDPFVEFLSERKGPMSTIGLMELMGFIRTDSTKEWPYPSVQFNHARYPKGCFQSSLLSQEVEEAIQDINKDGDIVVMMVFLLHPKKAGRLRIRSGDPRDLPDIESGLFNDPRDMTILLEAVRFVEGMAAGKSFSEADVRLRYINFPGAGHLVPGSRSYWEYAIRRLTSSAFHPVGTCPIGDVLDSRLRLKGSSNVRVADASAIPRPLSTNPNVPAIMIGERAARFIIEEHYKNGRPPFEYLSF